jgi:hypothetical protein
LSRNENPAFFVLENYAASFEGRRDNRHDDTRRNGKTPTIDIMPSAAF